GAAVGGTFSLNNLGLSTTSELVIPAGVNALDFVSNSRPLKLGGDILNYGNVYAVSTNAGVTSATIFANSFNNEPGGTISTRLPSALLSSIGARSSRLGLDLVAVNNIKNSGTILSSGALTLATIGGGITNARGASAAGAGDVT